MIAFTKKVLNKSKKFFKNIRWKFNLKFSKTIFVSFGENCLSDNIIERHGLKLFTSPFSHGRTNVEYILQFEADNYKNFLNTEYIQYESLEGKKVPRLKTYNIIKNDYHELHKKGFEFTHHDVIASDSIRLKFQQRVEDLQKFKKSKRIIILYHHRINPSTNNEILLNDLHELKEIYSKGKYSSEVVCFAQKIINDQKERKLVHKILNGIHFFEFHTLKIWEGEDQDTFWARCDEDLITEMVSQMKKLK